MADRNTSLFATGRFAFGRNLISNLLLIAVSVGMGIWFIPYLLSELGPERYGFLPMAGNVVMFLAIVTTSFSMVATRDLTVALEKDELGEAKLVFNTTLKISIGLAALFLIPVIFLAATPDSVFRIPDGILHEVGMLFALAGGAFFLSTAGIAFQTVAQARNRLDLYNGVSLLHRFTRVAVTIALFVSISPTLVAAGWALVTAAAVEFMGHVVCWKKLGKGLTISRTTNDRDRLAVSARLSGWIALSTLGAFLFYGADTILINRLLGAEATTNYVLAAQWAIILRMFASALSGTIHPTTVRLHASADPDKMCEHIQRSIKFVGYATAIGSAILCGFAESFLSLWVGPEFSKLAPVVTIFITPMAVLCSAIPMFSVAVASNRVRIPAFATIGFSLLSVALIWWSTSQMGWGLIGGAAAVTFAIFLNNVVFTPLHTAKILEVPAHRLYSGILKVVVASAIFLGITKGINSLSSPETWPMLITYGIVLGSVFLAAAVFLGLNRHDRLALKSWVSAN